MIETFLALIEAGRASDEEKHIILSAIFRNSNDGIVSDEGPPDIGLQSFVARQLSRQ